MPRLPRIIVKSRVLLDGKVNGQKVELRGRGVLEPYAGITRGRYVIGNLPKGLHPRILGAILITGYPESSKVLAGAENPFRNTSFSYRRTLDFGKQGNIVLNARCEKEPGKIFAKSITSNFRLSGRVKVPELASMEPLVETWVPGGPGIIYGHFTASWIAKKGPRIRAECLTTYKLDSRDVLHGRQHRFATFNTKINGNRMSKYQAVTLWRALPGHDAGPMPPLDFRTFDDIKERVESEQNETIKNTLIAGLKKLKPTRTNKQNKEYWEWLDSLSS